MCRGSAARTLYEAETLEQQTMHLHKCDHVFFYLGKKSGGVVRLTAKPRYLLLLHRGEKKSNTVTALIISNIAINHKCFNLVIFSLFSFQSEFCSPSSIHLLRDLIKALSALCLYKLSNLCCKSANSAFSHSSKLFTSLDKRFVILHTTIFAFFLFLTNHYNIF